MTFRERELQRLIGARDKLFKDPGSGDFVGKAREFVLREASANLWDGIRADAIEYFRRNRISWWKGKDDDPTGHLLSSQVACVNHLYPFRQRADIATAILANLNADIVAAELVDDGFVEFEFIGTRPYMRERAFSRGANCTSVDAFMIGRTAQNERRAFLIEWKYTERYNRADKYIPERAKVYDDLIRDERSPFKSLEPRLLYFEPFYQMMRQTLLGWQMILNSDHGCSSYCHVHVVLEENVEFHLNVTSAQLLGATVSEAWRSVLKNPELYVVVTPHDLIHPAAKRPDTRSAISYLQDRYWTTAGSDP